MTKYIVTIETTIGKGCVSETFVDDYSGIEHDFRSQAVDEIVNALLDFHNFGRTFDIREVER